MDKIMQDQHKDLKELEKEIDTTIDRLFVEETEGMEEDLSLEPLFPRSSSLERYGNGSANENDLTHAGKPLPLEEGLERARTHLFCTKMGAERDLFSKTLQEITGLQDLAVQEPEMFSVLNRIKESVDTLPGTTGNVDPSRIKLFMDAIDTLSLLIALRKDESLKNMKRLILEELKSRCSCWGNSGNLAGEEPSMAFGKGIGSPWIPSLESKRLEEALHKYDTFVERAGAALERIEEDLSRLREARQKVQDSSISAVPGLSTVTIFRIGERLFGIESDQVRQLYKIPETVHAHFVDGQRIRLKNLEVALIDLSLRLAIPDNAKPAERRILIIGDGPEHQGLLIHDVVRRITAYSESNGGGEYFRGIIRWSQADQTVEVPLLDATKLRGK